MNEIKNPPLEVADQRLVAVGRKGRWGAREREKTEEDFHCGMFCGALAEKPVTLKLRISLS